jgi:hypothetical protein
LMWTSPHKKPYTQQAVYHVDDFALSVYRLI